LCSILLSDRFYLKDHATGEFVHKTWEQLFDSGALKFINNSLHILDTLEEDIDISISTHIPYSTEVDIIFTGDMVMISDNINNESYSPSLNDLYIVHFIETLGCFGILKFLEEDKDGTLDAQALLFYRDIHPDSLIRVGSIYES